MPRRAGVLAALLFVLATATAGSGAAGRQADGHDCPGATLYDPDPEHPWNRVHHALQVRARPGGDEYGHDEVDPLLWRETEYLLAEPSHTRTLRLLDEFLATHADQRIADPLTRAIFQHDLWAVFDWLADVAEGHDEERRALMARLARMMRRVALTSDEIAALPDNYAAAVVSGAYPAAFDPAARSRAFLPADLIRANGIWVGIVESAGQVWPWPGGPIAPLHAFERSRSAFTVLWRLPGGAAATRAYWQRVWDHPEPFVRDPAQIDREPRAMPNPALPGVPDGTQVALLRRMLLVNDRGEIASTRIVQTVQMRVLFAKDMRLIAGQHGFEDAAAAFPFVEFRLRRRLLFAGDRGGLEATGAGDHAFGTFSSHGFDPFETPDERPAGPVLRGCVNCHHNVADAPVWSRTTLSILSLPGLLKPQRPDAVILDLAAAGDAAARRKQRRADWGMLRVLWEQADGGDAAN